MATEGSNKLARLPCADTDQLLGKSTRLACVAHKSKHLAPWEMLVPSELEGAHHRRRHNDAEGWVDAFDPKCLPQATFCAGSTVFITLAGTGAALGTMDIRASARPEAGRVQRAVTRVPVRGRWVLYLVLVAQADGGVAGHLDYATDEQLATLTTFQFQGANFCASTRLQVQVRAARERRRRRHYHCRPCDFSFRSQQQNLSTTTAITLATFWGGFPLQTSPTATILASVQNTTVNFAKRRWQRVILEPLQVNKPRRHGFFVEYQMAIQLESRSDLEFVVEVAGTVSPVVGPISVPTAADVAVMWATLVVENGKAQLVLSLWPDESRSQVSLVAWEGLRRHRGRAPLQIWLRSSRAGGQVLDALVTAYPSANNAQFPLPSCCDDVGSSSLVSANSLPMINISSLATPLPSFQVVSSYGAEFPPPYRNLAPSGQVAQFTFLPASQFPSTVHGTTLLWTLAGFASGTGSLTLRITFPAIEFVLPFTNTTLNPNRGTYFQVNFSLSFTPAGGDQWRASAYGFLSSPSGNSTQTNNAQLVGPASGLTTCVISGEFTNAQPGTCVVSELVVQVQNG